MATQQLATTGDLDLLGLPANALPNSITAGDRNAALVAASSLVAGYMRKRYTFPLVQWGQDVRLSVVAIAAYYLMRRRGFNPTQGADGVIIQGYRDQVGEPGKPGWLDRVSRGDVEPDDLIDATTDVEEASPLVATGVTHDWDTLGTADPDSDDLNA